MIHAASLGWKRIPHDVLAAAGVEQEDGLTFVPYRLPDGTLHNRRVFGSNGRTWWETPGTALIPYRLETLPSRTMAPYCAVVILEGESDTLATEAAYQYWNRGRAVRYVPVGLPGALTWKPAWAKYFEPYELLYVIGDGDDPGRTMNWKVAQDLPWIRRVRLPDGLDVRGVLQANPDGLASFFEEADVLITLSASVRAGFSLDRTEDELLVRRRA